VNNIQCLITINKETPSIEDLALAMHIEETQHLDVIIQFPISDNTTNNTFVALSDYKKEIPAVIIEKIEQHRLAVSEMVTAEPNVLVVDDDSIFDFLIKELHGDNKYLNISPSGEHDIVVVGAGSSGLEHALTLARSQSGLDVTFVQPSPTVDDHTANNTQSQIQEIYIGLLHKTAKKVRLVGGCGEFSREVAQVLERVMHIHAREFDCNIPIYLNNVSDFGDFQKPAHLTLGIHAEPPSSFQNKRKFKSGFTGIRQSNKR
jgi:hypothetical protein